MTKRNLSIFVIDDDLEMLSMLEDFLKPKGFSVRTFNRASEAVQAVDERLERAGSFASADFGLDLVITDIRMPEMTGLELLRQLQKLVPEIPVIVATGFGSIEGAVEAIRQGAYDYVTKPFKLSELMIVVERALEAVSLRRANSILRSQVNKSWEFEGLIGKCEAMRNVFDMVRRVSQTHSTVLITGESGTGKEAIARAIHRVSSRSSMPFVALNCSAIPENLLESELFGHTKGAFTGAVSARAGLFQEANGGVIFLDEIGDMDVALQAKILRVLQDKKVRPVGGQVEHELDVRVISATHKDLKLAIRERRFREDLYYRLAVLPIVVPPLRQRQEDIPLLAEFFLRKHSVNNNKKMAGFSPKALLLLTKQRWEGNVRELENVIERAVVLSDAEVITESDLAMVKSESFESVLASATQDLISLEELENRYIRFVLEKSGGNKEKAAQILGINRRTLYRKPINSQDSET